MNDAELDISLRKIASTASVKPFRLSMQAIKISLTPRF